ncbi:MAG: AMP-binding protein [Siculibacillus sp.]|nr:AMP-binding protein [Siculibacillus sp.]
MGPWNAVSGVFATARTRREIARRLAELDVAPHRTLRDEIEEWAAEHGRRPALVSADGAERMTHDDLAGRAARWTRWTILHGAARGEPVALLMANRPERVAAWLGVAASGAVADVVDPALAGETLAAAITDAAPRLLVVDAGLLPRFETAAPHLSVMTAVWVHGPHAMAYPRLDEALADLSAERLRPADRRSLAATDTALRTRTASGASERVDHRTAIRAMHAAAAACGATRADRLDLSGLGLTDPAAVLAVGIATTTGGLAVTGGGDAATPRATPATLLAFDGDGADRRDEAAARPRAGIAVGLGPDEARREADRLGLPRRLSWRAGEIATATGDLLWRA